MLNQIIDVSLISAWKRMLFSDIDAKWVQNGCKLGPTNFVFRVLVSYCNESYTFIHQCCRGNNISRKNKENRSSCDKSWIEVTSINSKHEIISGISKTNWDKTIRTKVVPNKDGPDLSLLARLCRCVQFVHVVVRLYKKQRKFKLIRFRFKIKTLTL